MFRTLRARILRRQLWRELHRTGKYIPNPAMGVWHHEVLAPWRSRPHDDFWQAYYEVYGEDLTPFFAHREEWEFHPGVEIDQYEQGH